ncbi:MAG: LacI family DNA-binding transcriptional regulator [Chloroflexia bacterium]|nr:LacI family DNA-binding transcriptional regulator [Chloroflexia bacterium]
MSSKRITITDIARESGASPTTVSLVLRDKPGIGTDTRDRVLAAAQSLGYERKLASSARPGHEVTTVAILFRARARSSYDRSFGVNPFYSWVLTGMESVARTKHMNLLYGTLAVNGENEIIDAPDHLLTQDLHGVIVVGAFSQSAIDRLLAQRPFPLVLVDGPSVPQRFDIIASDNKGGARIAVEHLIANGHREIGLISRTAGSNPNFEEREAGYRAAMAAAGLSPVVGRIAEEDVSPAFDQVLAQQPDTTALFCVNDQFALDAVKVASSCGYHVPATMSIIGFDNTDHAMAVEPGLTTMNVDKVGMGRQAVLALEYRTHWPDAAPGCLLLSPRLITRGTVAPLIAAPIANSSEQIAAG